MPWHRAVPHHPEPIAFNTYRSALSPREVDGSVHPRGCALCLARRRLLRPWRGAARLVSWRLWCRSVACGWSVSLSLAAVCPLGAARSPNITSLGRLPSPVSNSMSSQSAGHGHSLEEHRWFRKCKNSLRRMNSAPNFFARAAAAPPVRICLVQEHGGGAASQPRGLPGGVHPPSVRLSAAVEEAVFSHDCGAAVQAVCGVQSTARCLSDGDQRPEVAAAWPAHQRVRLPRLWKADPVAQSRSRCGQPPLRLCCASPEARLRGRLRASHGRVAALAREMQRHFWDPSSGSCRPVTQALKSWGAGAAAYAFDRNLRLASISRGPCE